MNARFFDERAPTPRNDPALFEKITVKVLRPFCVAGQRLEPGAFVELARFDAESLRALGKVEFTK